jgi:hypothetical protein
MYSLGGAGRIGQTREKVAYRTLAQLRFAGLLRIKVLSNFCSLLYKKICNLCVYIQVDVDVCLISS